MKILVFISIVLFSVSANAETLPPECRFIKKHKVAADVAYVPGVDVSGNAVVPADINAAPIQLPEVIRVPLTVDLIERVRNYSGQFTGVQAEADLGLLEIHRDGRVFFNGQDWSADIYAACGQGVSDAVESAPVVEEVDVKAEAVKRDVIKPRVDPDRELFGSEYKE